MIYPKAAAVKALPDYLLQVDFNNGERRLFDVKPYLHMPSQREFEPDPLCLQWA